MDISNRFESYKCKTLQFIEEKGGKARESDIQFFLIMEDLNPESVADNKIIDDILGYCSDHNLFLTEDNIKNPPRDNNIDVFGYVREKLSDEEYYFYPERVDILKYLGDSTFTCDTGLVFTNKTAQFLYNSIVKKEGIERAEDVYSFGAAYNCVRNFEIEDLENLYENDNYIRYHHGFGTFIRNNYVYPRSDLFSMADNGSCEIFKWIISIIKPQNIQKRKTESGILIKKKKLI